MARASIVHAWSQSRVKRPFPAQIRRFHRRDHTEHEGSSVPTPTPSSRIVSVCFERSRSRHAATITRRVTDSRPHLISLLHATHTSTSKLINKGRHRQRNALLKELRFVPGGNRNEFCPSTSPSHRRCFSRFIESRNSSRSASSALRSSSAACFCCCCFALSPT